MARNLSAIRCATGTFCTLAMAGLLSGCLSGGTTGATTGSTPQAGGGSVSTTSSGSFSLSWSAPQTRADGSPMSLAEIAGYRVYYGSAPGSYTDSVDVTNGASTSVTVSDVPVGDYYVVITTYDSDGRESAQSSAIQKQAG